MADLGGYSPQTLRNLLRRASTVRKMSSFYRPSRSSSACSSSAQRLKRSSSQRQQQQSIIARKQQRQQPVGRCASNATSVISFVAPLNQKEEKVNDRCTRRLTVLISVVQFVSGVSLVLLAVATLPHFEAALVFTPSASVALLDSISGALTVCIFWLKVNPRRHGRTVYTALVLTAISVIFTILLSIFTVLLARHSLASHSEFQLILQRHFLLFMILTPLCVITYVLGGAICTIMIILRITAKTNRSDFWNDGDSADDDYNEENDDNETEEPSPS